GPDAGVAQPNLLKIVRKSSNSGELRFQAGVAVANIGPIDKPVVPTLLAAFRTNNRDDIPRLIAPGLWPAEDNDDGDPLVEPEYVALEFFYRSGRAPAEIPELVKLSEAKSPKQLRLTAIAVLGCLESEADAALPKLREFLAEDDREVRRYAAAAVI